MKKILTLFLDNPVQIKLTNQMYSSKDENKYKLKIKSKNSIKLLKNQKDTTICIIKRKKHVTAEME
ncbi:hypothetical protein T05_15554 [Trichinella murrelli]|uniref:Uncharacterized protein n=1 Tax=Trichinella murrelli TaxID=144512 RepID=A0A0V0UFM0_9BILA|nr:hypothetical protein T05_15554 [Trichinella murrelli]